MSDGTVTSPYATRPDHAVCHQSMRAVTKSSLKHCGAMLVKEVGESPLLVGAGGGDRPRRRLRHMVVADRQATLASRDERCTAYDHPQVTVGGCGHRPQSTGMTIRSGDFKSFKINIIQNNQEPWGTTQNNSTATVTEIRRPVDCSRLFPAFRWCCALVSHECPMERAQPLRWDARQLTQQGCHTPMLRAGTNRRREVVPILRAVRP